MRLLYFLFLMSVSGYSQSFYEFKWTAHDIDHKGFLIYNSGQNMSMRVAYTTKTGGYHVAEYSCKRKDYIDKEGRKVVMYDGANAKVIHSSKDEGYGYNADNFYFIGIDENNGYQELHTNDDKGGEINTLVSYRRINPSKEFTKGYLNQFYGTNDPVYKKLINSGTSYQKSVTDRISKLTFIAIGDTNDPKLSKPVSQDINKYTRFFKMISKNLGIPYECYMHTNEGFTRNSIVNRINKLQIQTNEVVILFYRGHGFRWASQRSVFPRMKLGDSFNEESYNFEELHKILKKKQPRLLVSIGDLCNSVEGRSKMVSSIMDPISQDYSLTKLDISKAAELLSRRGSVITVSAKPGEESYSSYDYGFYSKSFIDSFMWEISQLNTKDKASWEYILTSASNSANKMAVNYTNMCQNALTKVNLK